MSSQCTTCDPTQPTVCKKGLDCSGCAAPVPIPVSTPLVNYMLDEVFQQYTGNCPLNLLGNNPTQWCYKNQFLDTYAPNPNGRFFPDVPETTAIGIDTNSLSAGTKSPTSCDQYYLPPPFDCLDPPNCTLTKTSSIEFLLAPPDEKGQPQTTAYWDKYTPDQCTSPQCDCTTRCLYDGSMPCNPKDGTSPQKVGPILSMPDWNGWTLQGYQCVPQRFGCNWNTGKCEKMAGGGYSTLADCQKNCIVCPQNGGFQVVKTKDGEKCYRSPFNAPLSSCQDFSNVSVCNGRNCGTNGGACGKLYGWEPHCTSPGFLRSCNCYCEDQLTTPFGAYQCTSDGYVLCQNSQGCAPPHIATNTASGCALPQGATVVRPDLGRDGQTPFQWSALPPPKNTLTWDTLYAVDSPWFSPA